MIKRYYIAENGGKMTKKEAIEFAQRHSFCRRCEKFFTEDNKCNCIKNHPTDVAVRWDKVLQIIDIASR